MKRFWKIFLISLGSLLLLVVIAVCIALWFVFSPKKLTPIVNKQAAKFVTCPAQIDRVELTFFSSFPNLGLKADGVRLINPVSGAPCDTLLRLDRLNAVVDVKAFLKRDELILSDIVLKNGVACLYADSLGNVNYDILNLGGDEPATEDEEGGFTISYIDADNVTLKNIDVLYVDDASLMKAGVKGLSTVVKGSMIGDDIHGELASEPFDIDFSIGRADSLMTATVRGIALGANASMTSASADADLKISPAKVTFAYAGDEYLKDGMVELMAGVSADIAAQSAVIRNGSLKLNGLEVLLDGSVRNDTLRGIDMNLAYRLSEWPLSSVFALIPASFAHYLDGIDADGKLSAHGTAVGIYGEGSMPMIDANVVFDEGSVSYPEMLPYPLTGVFADMDIHTDLESDAESYVKINDVKARTPKSSLRASGRLDRLFSDPHANLVANLNADFADVKPFLPDDLDMAVAGKLSGRVKADVRVSQLEKMQLEKMKVSGSLLVSNLDASYDTIKAVTPSAKIDFSLPNATPSSRSATFAAVSIASDDLAVKMGEGTNASLKGTRLAIETSDIRDTLHLPALVCDFSLGKLEAVMDDMAVSVVNPVGKASMEPGRRSTTVPRIKVLYNSDDIAANMGDEDFTVRKLNIDATVIYDDSKEDVWQMLSPRGYISGEGAVANISMLNYPVEIPELAMDFTPRKFNIEKARIKLNQSDFSLDGTLDNILPYFRGDSVLRGEFNFNSPVTDVSQLLALTNGIGTDEEKSDDAAVDEFTGPYMVPQGIDITLHTKIDRALWYGEDISKIKEFSRIHGDITIRNGEVFMTPELAFSSPATDGEIVLHYRTPRRNHLFASVILHLNRIDFKEALDLIPDLDTIIPMLRSFEGKGEFHLEAEGYMDSTYRFKMSTLLGACSISATDLVLRDEELFRTVAKFMKYKDEGVIRVDSLSADFTVFRDQITVYPFLFSVDRYKAVVSGSHNLDMTYNYNISLVQSPIPFRVAVTITGTPDDFKFKLSKSKYPDFYRPKRSPEVQTREMEMRQQIRNELLKTASTGRKEEEE